MKHSCHGLVLILVILFTVSAARSQISLTKTDLVNNLKNIRWFQYDTPDTVSVNLLDAVGYSQTWHFRSLHGSANTDTSFSDYFLPAGQLRAENFPDAELSSRMIIVSSQGGYTMSMTDVSYYKTTANGGYLLGDAMRHQISPTPPPPESSDTTVETHYSSPGRAGFPFGSLGTTLSTKDTVVRTSGYTEYSTLDFTINGFGNATFPDGQTKAVLRMSEDRVTWTYDGALFISRDHERYIHIIAQDFTQITFNVDTNYTGGTTVVRGYNFNQKGSAVPVRPLSKGAPENFSLSQNYPNPFNPMTEIFFSIAGAQFATLKVFTILGGEVATLVNQSLAPGEYRVQFNAGDLPSGLYFYRLSAGGYTQTKRMVLLK